MSDYAFRKKLAEIGRNHIKEAVAKPSVSGVGPNQQYEEDLLTLGPAAFSAKYGSAAQTKRIEDARDIDPFTVASIKNNNRTAAELALDATTQVSSGFVRTIGTIGSVGVRGADLAAQALDPRAPGRYGRKEAPERFMGATNTAQGIMDTISGAAEGLAGAIADQETDNMKAKSAVAERGVAAKKADSRLEFEASDKSTSAMLAQFGREVTIGIEKYEKNPAIFGKTANEALGSAFPSIKATSALTKLADPVIDSLGLGVKTTAGAKLAVTALGVGALEGQSAYDSTVFQIRGMSFEELKASSPEYNDLLAEDMSPEAARDAIAIKAGEKARLVQMGFATIAGGFVSKFEGGDLAKKVLASNLTPKQKIKAELGGFTNTLLSQTVEEGFQSGTGELSGNLAIKEYANKDLNLAENVGESVVQGAVGGFGATQTLLAPQQLGFLFDKGAKGASALTTMAVAANAEAVMQQEDDKSPVGEKATTANIKALDIILKGAKGIFKGQSEVLKAAQDQGLPDLPEGVQQLLNDVGKAPLEFVDTDNDTYKSRTALFEEDIVPGSRIKTLERVLKKLNADIYKNDAQTKAAAVFAVEETHAMREFLDRVAATEEAKANQPVPEGAPAAETEPTLEEQVAKLANQVMQGKLFSTGFDKATEILNNLPEDQSAPLTPREAITNPVGVNPARISKTDKSTFSENQLRALNVIEAIQPPEFSSETGLIINSKEREKSRKHTTEELLFRDKQSNWGQIPSFNTLVSLALKGGIKALRPDGNTEVKTSNGVVVDSQDVMSRMRDLIKHQTNKFVAATESYEFSKANPGVDSEKTFESLNPKTLEFKENGGKHYVNSQSEESFNTYKQIREDTNSAIRAHNALLEQFPEVYKGDKIDLLPEITDTPKFAVKLSTEAKAEAVVAETKGGAAKANDKPSRNNGQKRKYLDVQGKELEGTVVWTSRDGKTERIKKQDGTEETVNVKATVEAKIEAKVEPAKDKKTVPTVEAGPDPIANSTDSSVPLIPQYAENGKLNLDYLEFKDLFKDGTETTFLDAMKYLNSLSHMTLEQRLMFEMLRNSTFFKANHGITIRLGKSEERSSDKSHGWYDPALKEMVIFEPRISKVLHEMVHATTLEILTKNLFLAYKGTEKLTTVQEAAKRLLEMTNEFIDTHSDFPKIKTLQKMMLDLMKEGQGPERIDGKVRAISEFMAYGLTEKFVTKELKQRRYENPNIAIQLKNILVKIFSKKSFEGSEILPKTAIFDQLFFDTKTLTEDTTTVFSPVPARQAQPTASATPFVAAALTPTPEPSAQATPAPQATAVPVKAAATKGVAEAKVVVAEPVEVNIDTSVYITESESAVAALKQARDSVRELLTKLNFKFVESPDLSLSELERVASKYITGLHNDDPAFLDEAAKALSYALYTDVNESVGFNIPRTVIEKSLRTWLEDGKTPKVDKTVWTAVIDSLNKLMSLFNGKEFANIESALETTIAGIMTDRSFAFEPKAGFKKLVFQKELDNNPLAAQVLISVIKSGLSFTLTGSVAYADQVPVYRKTGSPLHDVDLLFDPKDVDAAFKWFSKGDPENWGDAKTMYAFSPGGIKVIGIAAVPAGYEIRNLSSIWNVKANNPQRSYDVHSKKTGEKVGSYFFLRGSKETFEGLAGITIDLIGDAKRANISQSFTHNGKSIIINVSSYIGGFAAKLGLLRPKDVVDFKAVIPPTKAKPVAVIPEETSAPAEVSEDVVEVPKEAEVKLKASDQIQPADKVKKLEPVNKFSWARTGGYEVSSAGDKRFSAFNAKLSDGRSIEEHYQMDVKGYASIKEGKGKPPKSDISKEALYTAYLDLWREWAESNPELIKELRTKGPVLTDKFANTPVNQARALADILNETAVTSVSDGTLAQSIIDAEMEFSGSKKEGYAFTFKDKALAKQYDEVSQKDFFAFEKLDKIILPAIRKKIEKLLSSGEKIDVLNWGGNNFFVTTFRDENSVSVKASEVIETKAEKDVEVSEPTKPEIKTTVVVKEKDKTEKKPNNIGKNGLKDRDGKSMLAEAYTFDPVLEEGGSVMALVEAAQDLPYNINDKDGDITRKAALEKILKQANSVVRAMNEKLAVELKRIKTHKQGDTYYDALRKEQKGEGETDVLNVSDRKHMALIDQAAFEKGIIQYDQHLLKLAVLATMDYVINNENTASVKLEDVTKILGLSRDTSLVNDNMLKVIHFGRPASDMKELVANHIKDFWGAKENRDTSETITKGIVQGLAFEIIELFAESGNKLLNKKDAKPEDYWFQIQSFDISLGARENTEGKIVDDKKTYLSVRLGKKGADLRTAKSVLADVLTKERLKPSYSIGEKIEGVDNTPIKDRGILNPDAKISAAQKQQDMANRISPIMLDMFEWLFPKLSSGEVPPMAWMLGWTDLAGDTFYNNFDRISKEGKNSSIKSSLNKARQQIDEIIEYARSKGIDDFLSVPTYYPVGFSRNTRYQMRGFNPVADKLSRELFVPGSFKMDLTDSPKGAKHRVVFHAEVLQAMGFKIENDTLEKAAEKAEELLATVYAPALEAIYNQDVKALMEFMKTSNVESTDRFRLIKALATVVKVQEAYELGNSSITIDLAIEFDGKTNGPIASAVQNDVKDFSVNSIETYRSGGFFIGRTKTPNGEAINYASWRGYAKNAVDFYEAVAQGVAKALYDFKESIIAGRETKPKDNQINPYHVDNVIRVQTRIIGLLKEIGQITFIDGKPDEDGNPTSTIMKIERLNNKLGVTQKIYGSGLRSIAAGIANLIFDEIYKEISSAVQTGDQKRLRKFGRIVEDIFDVKLFAGKEGLSTYKQSLKEYLEKEAYKNGKPAPKFPPPAILTLLNKSSVTEQGLPDNAWLNRMKNFQFNAAQFERLESAILHTYLPAFETAFTNNVGSSVKDVTDLEIAASSAASVIHQRIFAHALDKETVRQRASGQIRKNHELSANSRETVVKAVNKYIMFVDTGTSTYSVTGGEFETTNEVETRQRKDKNVVGFNPFSQTFSGTRTANKRAKPGDPGVKIAPFNVITNADADLMTDFNNDPKIGYDTLSIHDAIAINNLDKIEAYSLVANEAVYNTFIKNTIQPVYEAAKAILENQQSARETGLDFTMYFEGAEVDAFDVLRFSARGLKSMSLEREAKIFAIETLANTTDGTPGGQSPFVSEGIDFVGSDQDLVDYLNNTKNKKLAELIAQEDKESGRTVTDRIEIEPKEGSKLRKALKAKSYKGAAGIKALIDTLNVFVTDPDQRRTLAETLKSSAFQELLESGFEIVIEPQGTVPFYNPMSDIVHVSNVTPETIIHELVHATTINQLVAHYADPTVNPARAKAVARLESLADHFKSKVFEDGSIEKHVQEEMDKHLLLDDKVSALNEFMAWSLSNKELIARGKKRIATDALSQIAALSNKVIDLMRRLLGYGSDKVFDHVLFNTMLVMNSSSDANVKSKATLRHQIYTTGVDTSQDTSRKITLLKKMAKQVSAYLDARRNNDTQIARSARIAKRLADYTEAELKSLDALSRVEAAGFQITTPQDILLFKSLQSMFSLDLSLDKLARLEAQKLFEAVSKKLSPAVFLDFLAPAGTVATQNDEIKADRMYRAVVGLPFTSEADPNTLQGPSLDSKGLSDRLSVFMALAQTSPVLREVLEKINFKDLQLEAVDLDAAGIDALLNIVTDKTFDAINRRVLDSKQTQDKNVQNALDVLTEMLLSYETEAATGIENSLSGLFNVMNNTLKGIIEAVGTSTGDALKDASERVVDPNNPQFSTSLEKLAATALGISSRLASMLSDSRAEASTQELVTLLNNPKIPENLRNLFGEALGMTKDTKNVYKLVKAAKQQISGVRQEFVEKVPQIIAARFSDAFIKGKKGEDKSAVTKRLAADWAFMADGFSKTDISLLMETMGEAFTLNLFGDLASKKGDRQNAIKEMRQKVREDANVLGLDEALTNKVVHAYFQKSSQLSEYMATYNMGKNLLRSATSIVGLFNEDGLSLTSFEYTQLQKAFFKTHTENLSGFNKLVYSVDMFTSLEAVHRLDDVTQARLRKIVTSETEAVKDALAYMGSLRKQENEKTEDLGARINGYKGYTYPTARKKYSIKVADDADFAELRLMGYVRLRDYKGIEEKIFGRTGRGVYFSAHTKLATYNQGAMQTIQDTYNGVDPRTGQTIGPQVTGEFISGLGLPVLNRKIKEYRGRPLKDNLLPVFSGITGKLIGYEQHLAPELISTLQFSNNFAENLGRWSGRIQEEKLAIGANMALLDKLKIKYEEDVAAGRGGEYAEFGRVRNPVTNELDLTEDLEKDQIWAESYFLIPKEIREYGHSLFNGPIMIRRDMINNSLGFRSASVADIYTGKTRLNKEVRGTIKNTFIAVFGIDGYKHLTLAEEIIQTVVSEVKHTIVVKSGIILMANTISNVAQLAGREVPLSYMAKRTRTKVAELNQYKNNEALKVKLRVDLFAATSKSVAAAIQNRIDTIVESEKRMSIWPLIEANQFTTISEGLTDADKSLMDGRFMDWIEKKAGELPGPLSTVARYAIVSKDTALYQGLARAVQYSDFVAKAVYFDFMTEERGVSKEDALDRIDSEFINYDLNDSRTRSYIESIGLTWFMNFKIRSLKVAVSLLKNNPASVLLTGGIMSGLGLNVGSPVDDNLVAATAEGRIAYLGPGMVEAGWDMNIWNQLFQATT